MIGSKLGRLLLPKSDFVLLQVILEGERCARSDNRYEKIPRLCGFDQMFWPEDWVLKLRYVNKSASMVYTIYIHKLVTSDLRFIMSLTIHRNAT